MNSTKKPKSIADRIIQASFIVGLAHIFLKFIGLIQIKFATQYLDSGQYEAIMVVAFTGVINSLFLIGEEVIRPSFLTIFLREKEEKSEKAAWEYGSVVLSFQSILLLAVVLSIICFPDFYIHLFTKWRFEENAQRYNMLRSSLQILAPMLFFMSLGSTTYVMLNGYKKFFIAAFGDTSTKICIIIGLFFGMGIFGLDYRAFFAGLLIGSVAKLVTHCIGFGKKLLFFRPSLNWKNPAFRAMLLVMLPLVAGTVFAKVRDNFNNIYVLTHINEQGVLMANDLGRRLFFSIQWLVPMSLQIALFPFLCELASKNDKEKLGEILGTSSRMLLSIFMPAALCLSILAMPISVFIFYGGKTGLEMATWAGISTACYILVLPASAIESVLMQGYFAEQKTLAVTVIGLFTSSLNVFLSYIFIVHYQFDALYGLVAVALSFVFARFLKSTILAIYMQRNTPMFKSRELMTFLAKMILLTVITAVVTWFSSQIINNLIPDGTINSLKAMLQEESLNGEISRLRILIRLGLSAVVAAGTYLIMVFLLNVKEAKQMISWGMEKVKGKIK